MRKCGTVYGARLFPGRVRSLHPQHENDAKGLLTYAFANNVLENVKMQVLKSKIKKIIADKIGVNLGFEL